MKHMKQGIHFSVEDFKSIVSEIFNVAESSLQTDTDMAEIIKDSIDLGELAAVLKERHSVEVKDWDSFKVKTSLQDVFNNFE
jgi:acyl carrier protein